MMKKFPKKLFKSINSFKLKDGSTIVFSSYKEAKAYLKAHSYQVSGVTIEEGECVALLEGTAVQTKNSFSMAAITSLVLFLAAFGFVVVHAATNGGFESLSRTVSGVIQRVSSGENVIAAISETVNSKNSAVKTGSVIKKGSKQDEGQAVKENQKTLDERIEQQESKVTSPAVKAVNVESIEQDVDIYGGDYFELQVFGDFLLDSEFQKVTVSNEDKNNCDIQVQFDVSLQGGIAFTVLSDKVQPGAKSEVNLYKAVIEKVSDLENQGFGTVLVTTHCYDRESGSELNGVAQEVNINVSQ